MVRGRVVREGMVRRMRNGSGRAKLEQVARLAEVSTATVSRVFNAPDKVSEVVQARVRAAASTLNWIPNAAGRALALSRTKIAGAIIPTLDNEIFARQVSGLQGVFAERDFTLLLGCSNYDPDEVLNQVQAMLARGVEALAIVGEDHRPEVFEALRAHAVPYVVTYAFRAGSPHPCIGFDNRAAFESMADHVVSLGHRRLAVILQPLAGNDRVAARLDGIRAGLSRHGLALDAHHLRVGPSTMAYGGESFRELMAEVPRPTAVLCGNDTLAIGALLAAQKLSLRVPRDCTITGFDDLAIASELTPRLTTMWVDNFEIGRSAARHLLQAIGGLADQPSIELRPEIRIRDTSAPPRSTAR